MPNTVKNAYISTLGASFGGRSQSCLSKISEIKAHEHFEWIKVLKHICQDVLPSNGADTWIIRASVTKIDCWGRCFGAAFSKSCEYF